MACKPEQRFTLEEHKRKLFLQDLSPKTTEDSLEAYFSKYGLEKCIIKRKDGKKKDYGFVIFNRELNVNQVMSRRPHFIDGQEVKLYRSIPDQGPLKDNKEITRLIVSGFSKGAITQSDLNNYFDHFGRIKSIDMDRTGESCCIEFEDYDSVDRALLDRPHSIGRIEIQLAKAGQEKTTTDNLPTDIPASSLKNEPTVTRKGLRRKQRQRDSQISTVKLPEKNYCVHIENISSNADGERLADELDWPIEYILINSSSKNQSSSIECWLQEMHDQKEADEFVKQWDQAVVLGSKIHCSIEEDQLDLCREFRVGACSKTSEECDWRHIKCPADGKCLNSCPYGHDRGQKIGNRHKNVNSNEYCVKVFGSFKKISEKTFDKVFDEKSYLIHRINDNIVTIGPLRSIKYARRLLNKYHHKRVDGQELRCQIEYNLKELPTKTILRSVSATTLNTKATETYSTARNLPLPRDSHASIRENSETVEDDPIEPRIHYGNDFDYESKLLNCSITNVRHQKVTDEKNKSKSFSSVSSSLKPRDDIDEMFSSSGIRTTTPYKQKNNALSCHRNYLVQYEDQGEEIYQKEMHALTLLKDVSGVIQLLPQREIFDNEIRQACLKNKFSYVTTITRGKFLKNFVETEWRDGFTVLEAIQLVQKLTTIVKAVHSRNILHQNLSPKTIIIDWNFAELTIDHAKLILTDFSDAYIKSNDKSFMNQSTEARWYTPPQANDDLYKYSSTIDASGICAIFLWLLTTKNPEHSQDKLPHQQDDVIVKLQRKIVQTIDDAKEQQQVVVDETRLKTYLIDTFDMAFGYPQYSLWSINNLECRLELIHELLRPANVQLNTTEVIFKNLVASSLSTKTPSSSVAGNPSNDAFQKMALAIPLAKKKVANLSDANVKYSWSNEENCTWLDSMQTTGTNERRHDDILTYKYQDRRLSGNVSIVVTFIAVLIDKGKSIKLSISSSVNGKTCRIPIDRYAVSENFDALLQRNFLDELQNLIKSIAKARKEILNERKTS